MSPARAWCAVVLAAVLVGSGAPAGAVATLEPTSVVTLLVVGGPPLTAGQSTFVRGLITDSGAEVPGASVHLMMQPYGSTTFTDVGTAVSAPDGVFSLSTPPLWQNTAFRWDYAGDSTRAASSSAVWEVPVSPRTTIRVSDRTPRVGQRVVVRGQTLPNRAGRRISVWTGIRPCWCDIAYPSGTPAPKRLARGVVLADGSYRLVIRLSSTGRKRIYALVGRGAGLLAGTSRYRHLRVG
ncbi:hypothetical protein ACVW00_002970 [Marmoricola sp. URHA0025 HA25]